MIQVTCRLKDYSEPAKPSILVENDWCNSNMVVLNIKGERYTVSARELKSAIENATNTSG